MVEFEWDEDKRRSNLEKHRLDFEDADAFFDGRPHVWLPSPRNEEVRFATTAEVEGTLYTLIWTKRDDAVRVISMRKA